MSTTPLQTIIAQLGSQTRLAELLGTSQSTVAYWVKETGQIPAEKAVDLEEKTGGAIPRWVSRPDLWDGPRPFCSEGKSTPLTSSAQTVSQEVEKIAGAAQ